MICVSSTAIGSAPTELPAIGSIIGDAVTLELWEFLRRCLLALLSFLLLLGVLGMEGEPEMGSMREALSSPDGECKFEDDDLRFSDFLAER